MKVILISDKCIGCGACAAICPKVFEIKEDGHSHLIEPKTVVNGKEVKVIEGDEPAIDDAINGCPAQIISKEN